MGGFQRVPRGGVSSALFFNRVTDDVVYRQADLGLLLREVRHGVNKCFEALPVLGDDYIG